MRAGVKRSALVGSDQLLYSATPFVVTVAAARALMPPELGAFSLGMAFAVGGIALVWPIVLEPKVAGAADLSRIRFWALLAAAALLPSIPWLFSTGPTLSTFLIPVGSCLAVGYELGRGQCLTSDRASIALLGDALRLGFVAFVALIGSVSEPEDWLLVYLFSAAGGVVVFFGDIAAGRGNQPERSAPRGGMGDSRRAFVAEYGVTTVVGQSLTVFVALVAGGASAGVFRTAQSMSGLLGVLLNAIRVRLIVDPVESSAKSMVSVGRRLAVLSVVGASALLVMGVLDLAPRLLGASTREILLAAGPLVAQVGIVALYLPQLTWMRMTGEHRMVMQLRIFSASVLLILVSVGGYSAGAFGASVGALLSSLISLMVVRRRGSLVRGRR